MGLFSIDAMCTICDHKDGYIVEREERNDPVFCKSCGNIAFRVMSVPNVSTAKLSASIPDAVGQGRFDSLRVQHDARKEVAKAKREYVANPTPSRAEEVRRSRKEEKSIRAKT